MDRRQATYMTFKLSSAVRVIVSLSALLCATTIGCGGTAATARSTTAGELMLSKAPDFSAVDLKGVPFKLSDHRGQVVLLNFFATWCAPCVNEMPHLRKIYEANKDKGFLLVVISADGADAAADVTAFGRRHELHFPLILDDDLRISSLFNPKKAAPFSVLIDRSGRVVVVHDGYTPGDEVGLEQDVVTSLVGGPTASASN